jgi:hypothetical protein
MKKILMLFAFFAMLTFGCEEIVAPIDSQITPTGRRVLVEEFTGIRCVNCPDGSKKLKELINNDDYGDYVIPVSIHAGFFSNPYDSSLYDFRTPEGTSLDANLLGPVQAYPAATINRTLYPNETELPISLSKWTGYIIQDLLQAPKVEVDITPNYEATSRQLSVSIDLDFSETVTTSLGISVMILENDIADYQLTKGGIESNYVHQHVLRTMLTNYTGDAIAVGQTQSGSTPTFTYAFRIPVEWNVDNCEIVAFVSQKGGSLDVLQANKAYLR